MGFWVSLLISFAFTVIGELLRPKPRIDSPKPTSLGDYRAPTADEARPIPVVYGTVRITGPNAVWWGDFEARPIRKKVKTGLFSSQRITLGYQYWLGMQLALSWGTVDELIGLEFDDKPVTLRNRVNTADLVRFDMDEPTLFSSDDPKNGVRGAVKFYPGTFNQVQNEYLATQFGEFTIPAYRGISHLVFEKCYLSNNDSLPPVAITVRRTPNTLGLTGGRENIAGDANPACMIYEIMTNTFWGSGIAQAAIDVPSFVAAANTLAAEGLGLSMQIDTAGSADEIIAEILRHVDGVVFIDPETGRFTMRLARNDYVVASLPEVNPTNVIADSFKYTRGSWDETKNTVKIKYIDRAQKFTERVIQQQNLANITARGGQVDADDFDYNGLSNATAANAVAARVLKTVSSPLSRVECEVNRTLFGLRPGSVFRLSWPQLGIAQIVYRVTEIDYGTIDTGVFRVRAIEDVFSVAAVSFANPPINGWQNPFGPAAAAARQSAFEVPYAMLGTMNGDRFIATTASPARSSDLGYTVWQDAAGGATFAQTSEETFNFTPNGTLTAPLAQNTASSGVTLSIGNGYGFDQLRAPTAEEANSGGAIARIISSAGEELISYTGLTVSGPSCTLTGVTRGVYDTVPLAHPVGSTVWFISEGVGFTQDTPYVGDGGTSIRLLPYNQRDALPLASATTISLTRSSRALGPYPPGGPLLNGVYMPAIITGPLTVSWQHRDRVAQGRTPISHQSGSVGPEAGTTYTLRLYDETDTLRRTEIGLTDTSYTWAAESDDCGLIVTPSGEHTGINWSQSSVYGAGLSATPENMRDGNSTTGAGTSNSPTEWIQADLGSAKSVATVWLAGGNLPGWGVVAQYVNGDSLQWSNDATNWTTVAAIAGVNDTGSPASITFSPVSARYWRILSNSWLSVTEFRLFSGSGGTRLNTNVRVELESVRGGLVSYTRHNYTVLRAGQLPQINPLPGTLNFLGNLAGNATVGNAITVQFQPAGLSGSAVWSTEPAVAGATISGVGLLSFTPPAAGSYTINVRLTDHPSLASVTRSFNVTAATVGDLPATNAIVGTLPNGYANVPYYAIGGTSSTDPSDGLFVQRATVNTVPWYTRSTGLPDGLSIVDGQRVDIAGMPLTPGAISATFSGGLLGTGATPLNATATIYPTPAFTVLNPFDRFVGNEVRFVNSTTPLLTARTFGQWNGRARAMNGMAVADAPRYWEVTVGALGTGAFALGMGVSASAGLVGGGGHRIGVDDGDFGYEIERPFSGAPLRAFISGRTFTPYTIGVPVAGTGVTLRFASRQGGSGRRLWIAVENGAWIGGGDPVANTSPTIDDMLIPGTSFWGDFRPALFFNGECEATINFGSQPWKYSAPSGYTGIAYSVPLNSTTENGWNNQTEGLVAGTTPPPPLRDDRSAARGTLLNWHTIVGFGAPNTSTNPSSVFAFAPKSSGRWQFEVISDSGYAGVTQVGLVPSDWANQVGAGGSLPRPGLTADSFGVRLGAGLEPGGSTPGDITSGGAVVGSLPLTGAGVVLTFTCDFDTGTVVIRRAGTAVGTYSLPVTGKPWVICAAGGQWAGLRLRTRNLAHPQAGFTNWSLTGS